MRTPVATPEKFTLYIPDLDNHILIENGDSGVVISATRDNISEKRKVFFIRRLAAEGFIPDRYEWFSDSADDGFSGVKWIVSASSDENGAGSPMISRIYTRRNAFYACLSMVWLLCFIWAARHINHGL